MSAEPRGSSAGRGVDGDLGGLQPLAGQANLLAAGFAVAHDPAEQRGGLLPIVQVGQRHAGAIVRCATGLLLLHRIAPGDVFRPFAERARREAGWEYLELEASHSPNIPAPDALATQLEKVAS